MKVFISLRFLTFSFLTILFFSFTSCIDDIDTVDDFGKTPDGVFTDYRDKKIYNYVHIGDQTWMAENLAFLPEASPPSIGSQFYKYYYVYGYYDAPNAPSPTSTENFKTYGVLYNCEAAKTACPSDWHLPSDDEWKILEKYLGMSSSNINDIGYRYTGLVGKKLKSATGWVNNGNGDNSSGFNALPGGYRFDDGNFHRIGYSADFWSSSIEKMNYNWDRYLYYNDEGVRRFSYYSSYAFSVRCIRD
ncbi:FISUMP domain-containing protein [Bacteroidota bacterium]